MNKLLSVVIPTYNRADFLEYSLEIHIPILKKYSISIFVIDNASTDNTEKIVKKNIEQYKYLHYLKNTTNIGADANFEKALKIPDTNYVWLLSDTYHLPVDGLVYLLNLIESHTYDVIVFNLENTVEIPTQDYTNSNELLNDLGAVMTCAAVNIYNKKLIENAHFSRYYNSHFIQTGIIFEDISTRNFLIHWVQNYKVTSLKHPLLQKTNWSHTYKAFEIGSKAWSNFVMSLPVSYSIESKMKCIMDFGKVSKLFTFKNLILLRSHGLLDVKTFFKYKLFFHLTIDYPQIVIFFIAVLPQIFLKIMVSVIILISQNDKINKLKILFKR